MCELVGGEAGTGRRGGAREWFVEVMVTLWAVMVAREVDGGGATKARSGGGSRAYDDFQEWDRSKAKSGACRL